MGFNLIWLWDQADRLAGAYASLAPCITRPPHVGRRFPFGEAPAAMRYLQGGGSVGKVVLETAQSGSGDRLSMPASPPGTRA